MGPLEAESGASLGTAWGSVGAGSCCAGGREMGLFREAICEVRSPLDSLGTCPNSTSRALPGRDSTPAPLPSVLFEVGIEAELNAGRCRACSSSSTFSVRAAFSFTSARNLRLHPTALSTLRASRPAVLCKSPNKDTCIIKNSMAASTSTPRTGTLSERVPIEYVSRRVYLSTTIYSPTSLSCPRCSDPFQITRRRHITSWFPDNRRCRSATNLVEILSVYETKIDGPRFDFYPVLS
mmetsp:Transcript_4732/g.8951  ORF Transcript_4732/g.8951 Transcript_4732/m.8951 type:complete len:237 (+) Transcript_4732:1152-1862(+)